MGGLQNLGIKTIQDVRIGKPSSFRWMPHLQMKQRKSRKKKEILANPVMEYFEIS
jgi:phosphoribosylformylglycinamidine (FGAM) synthase PurS component